MKKNQLIVIGTVSTVLFLFFILIYRSSDNYNFQSNVQLSIRIQEGVTLPNTYSDSLLDLLDIYESTSTPIAFSQTSLLVYKNDGSSIEIAAPISGMNQLRSIFSSDFYTYAERKEDVLRLKQNSSQYIVNFRNNSNLPAGENAIKISCTLDSATNTHIPVMSIRALKEIVKSRIIASESPITIYFTTEQIEPPVVQDPGDIINNPGQSNGPKEPKGQPENGENKIDEKAKQPEPKISCKEKDVHTDISFEAGLPNVFSWTEQPGYTYNFSLSCTKGDCTTGLSVNESNVVGGSVSVPASYDEATEKKYTATLTIYCNGKQLKKITKVVKLVCA
jgi:hypothetical protein